MNDFASLNGYSCAVYHTSDQPGTLLRPPPYLATANEKFWASDGLV